MLIAELMTSPAVTVTARTPVGTALKLLDEQKITALPVVDQHGGLAGIVSEADLVQNQSLLDDRMPLAAVRATRRPPAQLVGEVMTHLVVAVQTDNELETAIDLMRSTMIKSLPVLEHGQVVGMVSRSDVIHLLAGRDQRIRTEVEDLLRIEAPDWQVEVQDGIVAITGPSDPHERRLADILAGHRPRCHCRKHRTEGTFMTTLAIAIAKIAVLLADFEIAANGKPFAASK